MSLACRFDAATPSIAMAINIIAVVGAGLMVLAFIVGNGDMLIAGSILFAAALVADACSKRRGSS